MDTHDNTGANLRIALVLGDQLSRHSGALAAIDRGHDVVVMIETAGEATHVWNHRQRIALFLAAMRHHCDWLAAHGYRVDYTRLADGCPGLAEGLVAAIQRHGAGEVIMLEAGEWRVQAAIGAACEAAGVPLTVLADTHFLVSREAFAEHASGRRQLRMEYFYREQRRHHEVLMEEGKPAGGRWNFDQDNRAALPRAGPEGLPVPPAHPPSVLTREVLAEVAAAFPDHPGDLEEFDWPVTPEQAEAALEDFISHRLAGFGRHQDAMWSGEPFLWHSLIASCLNLKLLDPRQVIRAAEQAWRDGAAELAAVEGFIRQVLGWREFMRGVYWLHMPGYAQLNHFNHSRALPAWFWTGETELNCLAQVIGQTLRYGYAHHIQRLMVIGNFAVLAELDPRQVDAWFLAVYVDAVEWVQLPNTTGMALFADGGIVGSKPYIASGAYTARMSNYCKGCRFDPKLRSGERACPITRLYWRFLDRHREALSRNPRMAQVIGNLDRWDPEARAAIHASAEAFLAQL
jgi:deoxyribodipyrimidine photolyase-related protein